MRAFIGRVDELRALGQVSSTSDGTAAALVTGEPGCGKSRLLTEARLASGSHAFAVVGFESEQNVPLAAAGGLLRSLAAVPEAGDPLEALLIGGRARRGYPRGRAAADIAPLQIFEAARRAFRTVEPALLLVDDLQWVDQLSLSLCHYLIRSASEAQHQLAVFAATRPDSVGMALLATLPAERVIEIHLGPLNRAEGVALARTLDARVDSATAAALWRQAQGSPFWLEGLVLHGQEGGGLSQILTSRLRGASVDATALLAALAVAGRQISLGSAAELLDQPRRRTEVALRELVRRGLAVTAHGGARVSHDLIRSAAMTEMPVEARRRLHRAMATLLEREGEADIRYLREALEHRRAGGLSSVGLARKLARSSQRRLLGIDGLLLLAGLADEADPSVPASMLLQAEVATLAHELGEHEEALTRWSQVAERSRQSKVRAAALLEASRAAYSLGRRDEALALLSRSSELADGDELLSLERQIQLAAIQLWLGKRTSDGRVTARLALSKARVLNGEEGARGSRRRRVRRAYLEALRLVYEAAMQGGDVRALLDSAQEWQAEARGAGLDERLTAELALAAALRLNGSVREAVERFRRVRADADRAVLPHVSVDAGFWLARSLALLGELVEAEAAVMTTNELVQHVGDVPRARHRVVRVVCHVAIERGDAARALPRLEAEASHEPSEHQRIMLHADCAIWRARLDGTLAAPAVARHLAASEECAKAAACPRCSGDRLLMVAEALARVGERRGARAALDEWDALGRAGDELDRIMRLHARALAAHRTRERVTSLQVARAAAEASPYRLAAIWIRLDLGLALAETGSDQAITELRGVAADSEGMGAATVMKMAGNALRGLGVRTWRRGAAGSPMTEREAEVARLVARGATNLEVAASLFLSPKTVERHLLNVFRKLDVRNRTELALKLAEPREQIAGNP